MTDSHKAPPASIRRGATTPRDPISGNVKTDKPKPAAKKKRRPHVPTGHRHFATINELLSEVPALQPLWEACRDGWRGTDDGWKERHAIARENWERALKDWDVSFGSVATSGFVHDDPEDPVTYSEPRPLLINGEIVR